MRGRFDSAHPTKICEVEKRYLARLITWRSQVRFLPSLLRLLRLWLANVVLTGGTERFSSNLVWLGVMSLEEVRTFPALLILTKLNNYINEYIKIFIRNQK